MRSSTLLSLAAALVNVSHSFELSNEEIIHDRSIHDKRTLETTGDLSQGSFEAFLSPTFVPGVGFTILQAQQAIYTAYFTANAANTVISVISQDDVAHSSFQYDVFSLTSNADPTTELFKNPSFETGGGSLNKWFQIGETSAESIASIGTYPVDPAGPTIYGKYFFQDGAVGSMDGIAQIIPTVANTDYTLTFYEALSGAIAPQAIGTVVTSMVVVSDFPPQLLALSPVAGATNVAFPTITGESPPFAQVNIFVNGVADGVAIADSGGTFTYTLAAPLTLSSNSVRASVTAGGKTSVKSAPFTFEYIPASSVVVPTLALNPNSNTGYKTDLYTSLNPVQLDGTGATTTIIITTTAPDGTSQSSDPITPNADGTFSYTAPLGDGTPGPYIIVANMGLVDAAGNSRASDPLSITLYAVPDTPFLAGLSSDTDSGAQGDGITTFNPVGLVGTATQGMTIRLYNFKTTEITPIKFTIADNGELLVTTPILPIDNYLFSVDATDQYGDNIDPSNAVSVTIELGPSAPAFVGLTDPDTNVLGDGTTSNPDLIITGTGTKDDTIQLYVDSGDGNGPVLSSLTATVKGNGGFTIDSPATPLGVYIYTATQTDGDGNVSPLSQQFIVTVQPAPPTGLTLSPNSDTDGVDEGGNVITYDNPVTIVGNGVLGSDIALIVDGATVATTTADGTTGDFSVITDSLDAGLNSLTATSTVDGITSDPSDPFVFDIEQPDAPFISSFVAPPITVNFDDTGTTSASPAFKGTAPASGDINLYDTSVDPMVLVGTGSVTSQGTFQIGVSTPLSVGDHLIVAQVSFNATETLEKKREVSASSNVFPITILAAPTTVPSTADGCTFLGCYRDPGAQLLTAAEYINRNDMSVEICDVNCAGYKYFGVENSGECYCGNTPPTAAALAPTACSSQCNGNPSEICGGTNRIDVYVCAVPRIVVSSTASSSTVSSTSSSSQSSSLSLSTSASSSSSSQSSSLSPSTSASSSGSSESSSSSPSSSTESSSSAAASSTSSATTSSSTSTASLSGAAGTSSTTASSSSAAASSSPSAAASTSTTSTPPLSSASGSTSPSAAVSTSTTTPPPLSSASGSSSPSAAASGSTTSTAPISSAAASSETTSAAHSNSATTSSPSAAASTKATFSATSESVTTSHLTVTSTVIVSELSSSSFVSGQSSLETSASSASGSQASASTSAPALSSSSSFSGTPSGTSSSALSSTTTSIFPSVSVVSSGFLIATNNVPARKRQASEVLFLTVNADGTVSETISCLLASIFSILSDGRLIADGLTAFVTPLDVTIGLSPFAFGAENPANIETTFTTLGGGLQWNNAAFTGTQAIFAFTPTVPLQLQAIYDGTLPAGYTAASFDFLNPASPAAAAAGCPGFSSTAPIATSSVSTLSSTASASTTASLSLTSSVSPSSIAPASFSTTSTFSTTSPPAMTTSTVCKTVIYTITKCPPTVYNCPYGQVTTEIIPLYTTVCPVEEIYPGGPKYPGGPSYPNDPSYPDGASSAEGGSYPDGSSYPEGPSYPVDPAQTGSPSYPDGSSYDPAQPGSPNYPVGTAQPVAPYYPVETAQPGSPYYPVESAQAGGEYYPAESAESGSPYYPVEPAQEGQTYPGAPAAGGPAYNQSVPAYNVPVQSAEYPPAVASGNAGGAAGGAAGGNAPAASSGYLYASGAARLAMGTLTALFSVILGAVLLF